MVPSTASPGGAGPSSVELAVSTVIFSLRADADGRGAGLGIPLVRRIRSPFQGMWALPGGMVPDDAGLEAAARHTLQETTALEPTYLEQLYAFGDIDRSPDRRVVSIVYWALVRADEAGRVNVGENVKWFGADDLPALAFDHNLIVEYALWRLRTKVEYGRIAHAFLGDTFTLSELREVHETVLRRELDPANFRRQIETSGAITPTDEVVLGGRHRPPRLYRFDTAVGLVDNGPLTSASIPRP